MQKEEKEVLVKKIIEKVGTTNVRMDLEMWRTLFNPIIDAIKEMPETNLEKEQPTDKEAEYSGEMSKSKDGYLIQTDRYGGEHLILVTLEKELGRHVGRHVNISIEVN